MKKGIYTYYKERLVEIGGKSKCLYVRTVARKSAYDIGHIFEGRENKVQEFLTFLRTGGDLPLTLISPSEKRQILNNLEVESQIEERTKIPDDLSPEDRRRAEARNDRIRREAGTRAIENEIKKITELKREIEEIEKETGRYELYIGYPFVFGSIGSGTQRIAIKAPLMLFPVRVEIGDDGKVLIFYNANEKIQLNRALIFAYAQAKHLDISELELEFDNLDKFPTVEDLILYLAQNKIRIECPDSRNIYTYSRFKEPEAKSELSVRYGALLARFPLANSIYNDYSLLEKHKLTTPAIEALLSPRTAKRPKPKRAKRHEKEPKSYVVRDLDFAQSEVIRRVNADGNIVVYGPPGTGKSQTIVNIIANALGKNQRVLVVSQKKAALDVVFSRLGLLQKKAMFLTDESKQKHEFYKACHEAHQRVLVEALVDVTALEKEYDELEEKISCEMKKLETITRLLSDKRPFGLSLFEMYSSSYILQKNTSEYAMYLKLIENPQLMALTYKQLTDALFIIRSNNLEKIYYDYVEDVEKNPVIAHMKTGLDIPTLSEVKSKLEEIAKSRRGLFNTAKHPYFRQALAYYYEIQNKNNLDSVATLTAQLKSRTHWASKKQVRAVKTSIQKTLDAISMYVKEYDCLYRVLTPDGYLAVIDNILRGNTSYMRYVHDAIDNYISLRDVNQLLMTLDDSQIALLNFAYTASRSYNNYTDILTKLPEVRIYHEVLVAERECESELATLVDFENITARITKLKTMQLELANKLCSGKTSQEYDHLYEMSKDNKDYLYAISRENNFWPIRKTMEMYGKFILTLFPCWLLSPENVSSLLPLEKDLFDLVIFDEASQVFIESTIPSIFRGKHIVVAGDSKQLRPSATFMRRYLGADPETQEDVSVQAALEVESLLDLAVARYDAANITYHYRSRHSELIDFSNNAFYGGNLQVAPNISRNTRVRPIERYKVSGEWVDRRNVAEAKEIIRLLRELFRTREHKESIGIITFNADQATCIADLIDKECLADAEFRAQIQSERARRENGEDTSLFVKNLENVQGDERDIIIFSIGYAPNAEGKVYSNFGSLSAEGGENRLNVAITRAKSRIMLVTSIEPEQLHIEGAKNLGPKLLRKYLEYVRAVSLGQDKEVHSILDSLLTTHTATETLTSLTPIEERIAEKLTKAGYEVHLNLGNENTRLSLAIYDSELDRYLVGVVLDKDAFASSSSIMERDVYKPKFLASRGWSILRVWCRDWWLSPQKVIKSITSLADKNRTLYKKSMTQSTPAPQLEPTESVLSVVS